MKYFVKNQKAQLILNRQFATILSINKTMDFIFNESITGSMPVSFL